MIKEYNTPLKVCYRDSNDDFHLNYVSVLNIQLHMGNINAVRDWGHAKDFVEVSLNLHVIVLNAEKMKVVFKDKNNGKKLGSSLYQKTFSTSSYMWLAAGDNSYTPGTIKSKTIRY